MLRRYLARRKMRWAVRYLVRMPQAQRQMFRLARMQGRLWAAQRLADEKLLALYDGDPWAAKWHT